ncbi:hypothetical protein M3Y94_00877800 [Aphelenchoides besseyi]|nr:hypothetical protein M3Y94_00877800 [Aphelenchoides besseyi]KAI6226588.1 hypothetical protein M3Y95_00636700 [Aphelenchoides besseyi]
MSTLIREEEMESDALSRTFESQLNLNKNVNSRRKLCYFGYACRKPRCNFAHSKEELNTTPVFNQVCNKLPGCVYKAACHYIHPNEPDQKKFDPNSTPLVYSAPRAHFPNAVDSDKPNLIKMQDYLQQSAKELNLPEPHSVDFPMPKTILFLPDGTKFVVYDSREDSANEFDSERVIIFGTPNGLKDLRSSNNWAFDSSKRNVPKHFAEMTSVFALVEESEEKRVRPSMVVLSTQPIHLNFRAVLDKLVEAVEWSPSMVYVDQNQQMIIACKRKFRSARILSCFFHFCRRIYDEIEKNDVVLARYSIDPSFEFECKRLAMLAIVPVDKLREAFDLICSEVRQKYRDMLDPVFEFIEKSFIGNESVPDFDPAFWNLSDRVRNDLLQCSNSLAAWSEVFGKPRKVPGVWSWINKLRSELPMRSTNNQGVKSSHDVMFEKLKTTLKMKKELDAKKVDLKTFIDKLALDFEFPTEE